MHGSHPCNWNENFFFFLVECVYYKNDNLSAVFDSESKRRKKGSKLWFVRLYFLVGWCLRFEGFQQGNSCSSFGRILCFIFVFYIYVVKIW